MTFPQFQQLAMNKKVLGITAGVVCIILVGLVYTFDRVLRNEPVIPGQQSLVDQYTNSKYGTGLPPGSKGLVGKETTPDATPETTNPIVRGKVGEDPAAVEKLIPVSVAGVLTLYPKQRSAAEDEYYGYLVPESGTYKQRELTMDFIHYRNLSDETGVKTRQFMGQRVKIEGNIYRQFVDPKKPTKLQYVVLVDTIEFATKSAEKK